jgi:hypothetical protein
MLKVIAVITMTIDHVGAILFPELLLLRVVGRLAFPLFCYLLVLGVESTTKLRDYLVRLLSFALVSQIPYFLAFEFNPFEQLNIFFTLFFSALAIRLFKKKSLLLILPVLAAVVFNSEGSIYGIAFVGCMMVLKEDTRLGALALFILNAPFLLIQNDPFQLIQIISLAALPLIILHKHGWFRMVIKAPTSSVYFSWKKYFFYLYYPLHLAVIYLIGLFHF